MAHSGQKFAFRLIGGFSLNKDVGTLLYQERKIVGLLFYLRF